MRMTEKTQVKKINLKQQKPQQKEITKNNSNGEKELNFAKQLHVKLLKVHMGLRLNGNLD